MFIRHTFAIVYRISSIRQSLRALDLSTPTNKTSIKKQYLSLAKKYHPDSIQKTPESANQTQKLKLEKLKKQLQQKFVQINKAYQYLAQLTQQQINQNKDKQPYSTSSSSSSSSNAHTRRRTVEEEMRQQTYEYFNRRYQQQSTRMYKAKQSYYEHLENQYGDKKRNRLPIYKVVPEFFFGLLLLAFALGQWAYRAHQKKKKIESGEFKQLAEGEFPDPTPSRLEVFKRMNHNAMFQKQKMIREQYSNDRV